MVNNYDRIAAHYDTLSRMVFGKSIVRAQQALLPRMPAAARALIVGGGTGWILSEIARMHPSGLVIDYVEISANMLDLARKQPIGSNQVHFIHAAIEDFQSPAPYDVVMTPFLFDNFNADRASQVFSHLDHMLANGGLWLFTDFHIDRGPRRIWQKALLRSMYVFFRNISDVEARQLPDMAALFRSSAYELTFESFHFGRFIRSAAYRKSGYGSTPPAEDKPFVENDDR